MKDAIYAILGTLILMGAYILADKYLGFESGAEPIHWLIILYLLLVNIKVSK